MQNNGSFQLFSPSRSGRTLSLHRCLLLAHLSHRSLSQLQLGVKSCSPSSGKHPAGQSPAVWTSPCSDAAAQQPEWRAGGGRRRCRPRWRYRGLKKSPSHADRSNLNTLKQRDLACRNIFIQKVKSANFGLKVFLDFAALHFTYNPAPINNFWDVFSSPLTPIWDTEPNNELFTTRSEEAE